MGYSQWGGKESDVTEPLTLLLWDDFATRHGPLYF